MRENSDKVKNCDPPENYTLILILHKKKKGRLGPAEIVEAVYNYLSGRESKDISVDAFKCPGDWLKSNVQSGWNLEALVRGYYDRIESIKKAKTIGGYTVKELFEDMQGVTTGGNEYFIFTKEHYDEWRREYNVPDNVELVYDCIDGEDIGAFRVNYKKKILFPYIKSDNSWRPAFQLSSGKDALNFDANLVENEKSCNRVEDKLSARIARGLIPQKFAGIARYLVLNYDKLRSRKYEGKLIEEYSGAWYGFHRARSPRLLKVPNIVTPRVVQKPRFAINTREAIPLDTVIVLVPRDNSFASLINDLKHVLKREVETLDALCYVTALLNSSVSEVMLKVKATMVKGGYYTIDENYLSEMLIPKPNQDNKDLIESMISLARQCIAEQRQCQVDQILKYADDLYERIIRQAYHA